VQRLNRVRTPGPRIINAARDYHARLPRDAFCWTSPPSLERPMSPRLIVCAAACMLLLGFSFGADAQGASSTPSPGNSTFMNHAAADGLAEIRMGELALQKSSSPDVKKLARRIVADHTKTNAELKQVAQAHQVTLPPAPGEDAQNTAETLRAQDGAAFDRAWATAMVRDHQKAVASFSAEAMNAEADDVKAFARKTLPTLKTHLELARQLQDGLDASSGEGE
jgi:putative membrane protein